MTIHRAFLLLLSIAALLATMTSQTALAQETRYIAPPRDYKIVQPVHKHIATARSAAAAPAVTKKSGSSGLPLWTYSIVAGQDGNTYSGSIVGRSPFNNGVRATTVQAYLVPVIINFMNSDGSILLTFDPTTTDSCVGDSVVDLVQNSPQFVSVDFAFTDVNGNSVDVGTAQYGDAFQRANFWTSLAPSGAINSPYHTILNLKTLPGVTVNVQPSNYSYTDNSSCTWGAIDYDWWDSYVTGTLIPSLASQGVGPGNVPIFVFDSVVMYEDDNLNEIALGDHGSVDGSNPLQTYIVADYDTSGQWYPDISVLSHEVGEWINDPDNVNPTPAWSNPTVPEGGCNDTYEVGDGLIGTVFEVTAPNGVTYNPQELVYFSWFYDQDPSTGAGGSSYSWYSDEGSLTSDSGATCQGSINGNVQRPFRGKKR